MVWLNNSQDSTLTLCDAPHVIFNVFHILQHPRGARMGVRAGPARVPYGTLTDVCGNWHNQNWQKSRTGVVFVSTRPVHGLIAIYKHVRGPQAYNACIKNLRSLYDEAKFVRGSTGPTRTPWVAVRFLFKTVREQPGNSPYGARKCDVTLAWIYTYNAFYDIWPHYLYGIRMKRSHE